MIFEDREYQNKAAEWLAGRNRGIVQIPAGGGKSRVAAMALNLACSRLDGRGIIKIGWIAPTKETRDQGMDAINQFPLVSKQDLRVVCASPDVDMSDRDLLVVDECKHSASPLWSSIVEQCNNRWGLDATPFGDDDEKNKLILDIFGGEILSIPRSVVQHKLADARVIILNATDRGVEDAINKEIERRERRQRNWWMGGLIPKAERKISDLRASHQSSEAIGRAIAELSGLQSKMWSQCAWQACVDIGIVSNVARNSAIVSTALKHPSESILILVNQVEHGESIVAKIPNSVLCHSKMGVRARRNAVAGFRDGSIKTICGTTIFDEGADFQRASVLIMGCGGRSNAKAEQRTGRVLRLHKDKPNGGLIYDFGDEGVHPIMRKHAQRRQDLYRSLGYSFVNPNPLFG
jgi:superfamily II DNA or RNA helicase